MRGGRLLVAAGVVIAGFGLHHALSPSGPAMTPLERRIVTIAESQAGYQTSPRHSYCNKYSFYWHAGSATCPAGELSEEWCADFAAWVWHKAGVKLTYGYAPGDLNGAAVSFYLFAVDHHIWHTAKGYHAAPGDIAVYGLVTGAEPSAAHVAVVTEDPVGQAGPSVVDGDGDRTGFSEIDVVDDQSRAVASKASTALSGCVSPPPSGRGVGR
jgi:hypothetical protein